MRRPYGTRSGPSRWASSSTATTCGRRPSGTWAAAGWRWATSAAATTSIARSPSVRSRPALETRVRSYVNAAGSAYRCGRFDDARRYVADGLRLAADGEFVAGEYRLHLTSAAVSASAGDWDDAIAELRALVTSTRQAGVMVLLVRGLLARLLARRGEADAAAAVLAEALADPDGGRDSYVAGPLAVAEVELGWLAGTLDAVPPRVSRAMDLAVAAGHTAIQGEIAVYLRRAGHAVTVAAAVPEPWAAALAGRCRDSAAAWRELGERYEEAVETALAGDGQDRAVALDTLKGMGATATVSRVTSQAIGT